MLIESGFLAHIDFDNNCLQSTSAANIYPIRFEEIERIGDATGIAPQRLLIQLVHYLNGQKMDYDEAQFNVNLRAGLFYDNSSKSTESPWIYSFRPVSLWNYKPHRNDMLLKGLLGGLNYKRSKMNRPQPKDLNIGSIVVINTYNDSRELIELITFPTTIGEGVNILSLLLYNKRVDGIGRGEYQWNEFSKRNAHSLGISDQVILFEPDPIQNMIPN